MIKKNWIISITILVCTIISITVFSFVYHSQSGTWFPWWAYVIAISLFAIYVISYCIIICKRKGKFYRQLALLNFDIQKEYKWGNQIFCIDFASKRIACNLLLKSVIPFQALAGYSAEISDRTQLRILPQNKRSINLSISVIVSTDNKSLLHIKMYEIIVDVDDLENDQQSNFENLIPKYQLMNDLVEMQQDLKKIIEYKG